MVLMSDTRTPTLDAQAGSRRGILMVLKKRGRARAEELAEELGITASAVRQHLTGLLGDGLVAFEEVRSGPGRPKHVYRLTPAAGTLVPRPAPAADSLSPRTYSELTNELLDYAGATQPGLVDELFEMRRRRRAEAARGRPAGRPVGGGV